MVGTTQDLRFFGAGCCYPTAGGDIRGLMSAALLVVATDLPPLGLRIDQSAALLDDLLRLLAMATGGDYADWMRQVSTLDAPPEWNLD